MSSKENLSREMRPLMEVTRSVSNLPEGLVLDSPPSSMKENLSREMRPLMEVTRSVSNLPEGLVLDSQPSSMKVNLDPEDLEEREDPEDIKAQAKRMEGLSKFTFRGLQSRRKARTGEGTREGTGGRKSKARKTHKRKGAKKSHKRKHKKTGRRKHKSRKHRSNY